MSRLTYRTPVTTLVVRGAHDPALPLPLVEAIHGPRRFPSLRWDLPSEAAEVSSPLLQVREAREMNENPSHPLDQYVREIADLLGLREWDIDVVDDEFRDDKVLARIWIADENYSATIFMHPHWRTEKGGTEGLTRVLVHELLHLPMQQLFHLIESVEIHVGIAAWATFEHSYKNLEEKTIDLLARRIADFMPPPPPEVYAEEG